MIPLLWRYLLRRYFQVFLLCICGFVALLLVTRFREIASFTTTGAGWGKVGLFTLYQLPYILPFAIPVSCLIAALLLFQALSHSHELTALRASGLSLKGITYPLLLSAALLTLTNFTIVSELGPVCKAQAKQLGYQMAMINPLSLFQKDSPLKIKDVYVDMKTLEAGKRAEDLVFVLRNLSNERLELMTAQELWLEEEALMGKEVTFISSLDSGRAEDFDHLIIENQSSMTTAAANLTQLLVDASVQLHYDYLPLRLILAKRLMHKNFSLGKGELEICRRLSLSLAAFTFTLMGISFGIEISRNRKKSGLAWAIGLGALFMACFIGAKSFKHTHQIALFLYLLPHPLIALFSLRAMRRVSRGIA